MPHTNAARRGISLLVLLALLLGLVITGEAQSPKQQALQTGATATGNGTAVSALGYSLAAVQVVGTFSATVTFEATVDGANWAAVLCTSITDGSTSTTATAAGTWFCPVSGNLQFRARVSAYTSGAVTVQSILLANVSRPAPGVSGGGSGAPASAHYVTTQAESGLSAEFSLGTLTTGLLLNTVSGGVGTPSAYAGASCTNQFPRSLSASGAATCASVALASDVSGNLDVSHLGSGTSASSSTFWRGDGTWAAAGTGTVGGTGTDKTLMMWNGTGNAQNATVGNAILSGGTAGSVLWLDTGGALAQDNANLFWSKAGSAAGKALGIGTNVLGGVEPVDGFTLLTILGDNTANSDVVYRVYNGGWPTFFFARDNGTVAGTPAVVLVDQTIADLTFAGYNSSAYAAGARLRVQVDDGDTFANRFMFQTGGVEHLRLTSKGATGVATPNAASSVVTAGQVEMQGLLLSRNPGNTAGFSSSYYGGTDAVVIADDQGTQRNLSLVGTGQSALSWYTLRATFASNAATNTLQNGDSVGLMEWNGFAAASGVAFGTAAQLAVTVGGSVTAASSIVPGKVTLRTMTTGGVMTDALTLDAAQKATFGGAVQLPKMTASSSAPGAGSAKFEVVCGTNAGTAKVIVYAGTSGTAVTVVDNIGAGVTGC